VNPLSPDININFRILPFGHAAVVIRNGSDMPRSKESLPQYREPKTTGEGLVEISFDGNNYTVPKSTGGLF
jgi:hypothetical protein